MGYEPADVESLIAAIILIVLAIIALTVYLKLLAVDKRKKKAKEIIGEENNLSAEITSNELDMSDLQRDEKEKEIQNAER